MRESLFFKAEYFDEHKVNVPWTRTAYDKPIHTFRLEAVSLPCEEVPTYSYHVSHLTIWILDVG